MHRTRRRFLLGTTAWVAACASSDPPPSAEPAAEPFTTVDVPPPASATSETTAGSAIAPVTVSPRAPAVPGEPEEVRRAREDRKPVVLVFHAEWSMACKMLETKTFTDAAVQKRLERFVLVRVDLTNGPDDPKTGATAELYKVTGLPTILLFDTTGTRRADITTFVDAPKLASELDKIR